jgi:phi13 family phage major tail protein
MATVGLRDLYRAPITADQSGKETYGTPVRMAKAITTELSVEVAKAILYADDGAAEIAKEFVSGELKLKVNDLLPADLAAILGQTQDNDMVVYAGEADEAPYFAIGFRAKKTGGQYKYLWLYKVKFEIPNESYNTKNDGIEFATPEIVGQFIKRPDGLWKAEHVALPTETAAAGWFAAVREPNNTPATPE